MKDFNKKQKEILDEWLEKNKDYLLFFGFNFEKCHDDGIMTKLTEIKDFEAIGLSVNLYITEKILKEKGLK